MVADNFGRKANCDIRTEDQGRRLAAFTVAHALPKNRALRPANLDLKSDAPDQKIDNVAISEVLFACVDDGKSVERLGDLGRRLFFTHERPIGPE
jgi:hypothetical protein